MRSDVLADVGLNSMDSTQSVEFGHEPGTPRLAEPKQAEPAKAGGARRDRTDDLMLAKHALSQLSYGPIYRAALEDSWWAWDDSNVRPHPYQGCALTT